MSAATITVKEADFNCTYDGRESGGSVMERLGLSFPGLYNHAEDLARLAVAVREQDNFPVCMLPFCYTLEAEALGGRIHYGEGDSGPRVKEYAYERFEDLADLPELDLDTPRIRQVLETVRLLKDQGENVAFEVCGPISILNNLIDLPKVLKGWRKQSALMEEILAHLCRQVVRYAKAVRQAGVDILCYADPTGSYSILGPRFSRMLAEGFVLPFLWEIEEELREGGIMHLCPKTGNALAALELARWQEIPAGISGVYADRVLAVRSKALFVGETCIRDLRSSHRNIINELRITTKGKC